MDEIALALAKLRWVHRTEAGRMENTERVVYTKPFELGSWENHRWHPNTTHELIPSEIAKLFTSRHSQSPDGNVVNSLQ